MADGAQLVELGDSKTLVPNLSISVDNDEEENDLPEIEYGNTSKAVEDSNNKKTEVKRSLHSFSRKKLYENKLHGTAASLGLSYEEVEARRKKRAERFKSPLLRDSEEKYVEPPEECLAKSQQFAEKIIKFNENVSLDDNEFVRLESLHLIGVDKMSTNDIFAYFGSTNPRHIEWINDTTCNVVWPDSSSARIAMERVAQPYVDPITSEKSNTYDDDLDLENDADDAMETESSEKADVPMNPVRNCKVPFVKNGEQFLKIRYSVVGDRKEQFASKNSKYYRDHGNPHFGGATGLLSSSYRRRYQKKRALKEFHDLHGTESGSDSGTEEKRRKMTDEPNSEMQEQDESLLCTTVKDMEGGSDESDDNSYGTMMADRVSQSLKAIRNSSDQAASLGNLRVTKPNTGVRSRLGPRVQRNSSPKSALNRVEKRLRQETSLLKSKKSVESRRPLKRYSPPPWE